MAERIDDHPRGRDDATATIAPRWPAATRPAELTWSARGDGADRRPHAGPARDARGSGVAEALVEALVADAREQGFTIVPQCSYVEAQFRRHPEWADLLPRALPTAARREKSTAGDAVEHRRADRARLGERQPRKSQRAAGEPEVERRIAAPPRERALAISTDCSLTRAAMSSRGASQPRRASRLRARRALARRGAKEQLASRDDRQRASSAQRARPASGAQHEQRPQRRSPAAERARSPRGRRWPRRSARCQSMPSPGRSKPAAARWARFPPPARTARRRGCPTGVLRQADEFERRASRTGGAAAGASRTPERGATGITTSVRVSSPRRRRKPLAVRSSRKPQSRSDGARPGRWRSRPSPEAATASPTAIPAPRRRALRASAPARQQPLPGPSPTGRTGAGNRTAAPRRRAPRTPPARIRTGRRSAAGAWPIANSVRARLLRPAVRLGRPARELAALVRSRTSSRSRSPSAAVR